MRRSHTRELLWAAINMTISSRTPQGEPTACPLCRAKVVVEPSVLIGDAPCPQCGQWLWFVQMGDTIRLFDARETQVSRNRLIEILATQLGVDREKIANNPALFDEMNADSLDFVELVMELEAELGLL